MAFVHKDCRTLIKWMAENFYYDPMYDSVLVPKIMHYYRHVLWLMYPNLPLKKIIDNDIITEIEISNPIQVINPAGHICKYEY